MKEKSGKRKNGKDVMLPLRLGEKTHAVLEKKAARAGLYKSVFIALLIHITPVEALTACRYKEATEAKNIPFPIRIERETYNMLTEKAAACGMNKSTYIRYLIHSIDVCAVIATHTAATQQGGLYD